ncbi:hypothetical protein [Actinomadura mexicana]|uniref:Uncharacterized protein n=1 Tax=Actinomadura mexicana TaxID=134959 RepID=A0A238YS20_9ACTN|nr:hypothetical protein [Actinomadura mexicana]SNR73820.1 hypothetical protein SAMN06265355_106184 [Actinomadura mexicana]
MRARRRRGEEHATAFLLEELHNAEAEFRRLRAEGHARMTGFLTLVGATLGLVAALSGAKGLGSDALLRVVLAAALFIAVVGTNAYIGLVVRDIGTDACARAAARIRRYFVTEYPHLAPHVSWRHTDAPSTWMTRPRSVNRRQIGLITAAAYGGAAAAAVRTAFQPDGAVTAGVGLATAAVAWPLLLRWARRRMKDVADRARREQRFD